MYVDCVFVSVRRVLHKNACDSVSNPLPRRAKLPLRSIAGHAQKAGNAGKCTAWKTGTCGARSVSGRKHAPDSWTETTAVAAATTVHNLLIFLSFSNNNYNEFRSLLMPPTTMQLFAPINTKP